MRPSVVCAFLFLLLPCAACVGHAEDAHEPGARLGSYHVTGSLLADSCRATVLGVTPTWEFDVKLSRDGRTLYWLNGQEAIPGTIGEDGRSFGFMSGVALTFEAPHSGRPGCVMLRTDSAEGTLSARTTEVTSFEAEMSFSYAEQAGTDCAELLGGTAGFEALPCLVRYQVSAKRAALPPAL